MANFFKTFISGLSDKEKKFLYITGVIVMITLVDRMILGPAISQSKLLDYKIKDQVEVIRKNFSIVKHRDRIIEEANMYDEYYADKNASQEEMIASFLSEIEDLSKKAEINLTNINPVQVKEKEGYIELLLVIGCEGSMKNMLNFIYGVDEAKKPIRVFSFEMTPKSRENYEVKCNIEVTKLIMSKDKESIEELMQSYIEGNNVPAKNKNV
jgi:hypothetical protein